MLAPPWRAAWTLSVLVSAAALTVGSLSAMHQASSASPSFRTVERGSQSNVDSASKVVVRSAAEWTKLWKAHDFDKPEPRVDFEKEMVVGVFMGSRPTAGYTVEILSLADRDGTLVVSYREASPRPGTMAAQVLTFPYHLIATAKRSGEVKFEKVP
jgi:hypothetical protein